MSATILVIDDVKAAREAIADQLKKRWQRSLRSRHFTRSSEATLRKTKQTFAS